MIQWKSEIPPAPRVQVDQRGANEPTRPDQALKGTARPLAAPPADQSSVPEPPDLAPEWSQPEQGGGHGLGEHFNLGAAGEEEEGGAGILGALEDLL